MTASDRSFFLQRPTWSHIQMTLQHFLQHERTTNETHKMSDVGIVKANGKDWYIHWLIWAACWTLASVRISCHTNVLFLLIRFFIGSHSLVHQEDNSVEL